MTSDGGPRAASLAPRSGRSRAIAHRCHCRAVRVRITAVRSAPLSQPKLVQPRRGNAVPARRRRRGRRALRRCRYVGKLRPMDRLRGKAHLQAEPPTFHHVAQPHLRGARRAAGEQQQCGRHGAFGAEQVRHQCPRHLGPEQPDLGQIGEIVAGRSGSSGVAHDVQPAQTGMRARQRPRRDAQPAKAEGAGWSISRSACFEQRMQSRLPGLGLEVHGLNGDASVQPPVPRAAEARRGSPAGGSILTAAAPSATRRETATGPGTFCASLTTRTPASGFALDGRRVVTARPSAIAHLCHLRHLWLCHRCQLWLTSPAPFPPVAAASHRNEFGAPPQRIVAPLPARAPRARRRCRRGRKAGIVTSPGLRSGNHAVGASGCPPGWWGRGK